MENAASLRLSLLLCWPALSATAATVEIGPGADVRAAIAALRAGDELVLRGGTYSFNSRFGVTAVGTAAQPIVVRGKSGETAVIDMTTVNQNIIDVENSAYFVLRNLTFHGGSAGVRLVQSSYITIEDSEIYGTDDVGISANSGNYEGLLIRHNHIHNTGATGEGMYLGCNNNACRVLNSVIEWNYIHDTNGPTVTQGDGIEVKEGSAGNIIRHNVIHDTGYPGIITYSTVGNGGPNIIDSNVIWNAGDYAIQSAADSIIRNNIVLGTIGMQPHQAGSPSNQIVANNTIICDSDCVQIRGVSGSVVFANNAVYANAGSAIDLISGNLSLVTLAGNVVAGGVAGATGGFVNGNGIAADFVNGNFNGAPPIDLFPKASSALIGAGTTQYVTDLDFNGTTRSGSRDAGAYKYQAGGNPGWTLAASFKAMSANTTVPNPPTALTTQ